MAKAEIVFFGMRRYKVFRIAAFDLAGYVLRAGAKAVIRVALSPHSKFS